MHNRAGVQTAADGNSALEQGAESAFVRAGQQGKHRYGHAARLARAKSSARGRADPRPAHPKRRGGQGQPECPRPGARRRGAEAGTSLGTASSGGSPRDGQGPPVPGLGQSRAWKCCAPTSSQARLAPRAAGARFSANRVSAYADVELLSPWNFPRMYPPVKRKQTNQPQKHGART